MPARPKPGQSSGGGGLRSFLLQRFSNKQAQDNYAQHQQDMELRQKSVFDYEQQQKAKLAELERQQKVNDLAKSIIARDPSVSVEQAQKDAHNFIIDYGKQYEDLGYKGAPVKVHGEELGNIGKQQTNDITGRTLESTVGATNAKNSYDRAENVAKIPFADQIVQDLVKKQSLANTSTALSNEEQTYKNDATSQTFPGTIAATNARNSDEVRKAAQAAALNSVEQASKARGLSIKDAAPTDRYRSVVQPSSIPGQLFRETSVSNPNYQPKEAEALFGSGAGAGGMGNSPGIIGLQNGGNIGPAPVISSRGASSPAAGASSPARQPIPNAFGETNDQTYQRLYEQSKQFGQPSVDSSKVTSIPGPLGQPSTPSESDILRNPYAMEAIRQLLLKGGTSNDQNFLSY